MVSVLIAPDKFKGSLSADEAARALERGLLEVVPRIQVDRLALADGGEGSVAAACTGRFSAEKVTVTGPTGRPCHGRGRGARPYRAHRGGGHPRTRHAAGRPQDPAHGHEPGHRAGPPVRGGHDRPRARRVATTDGGAGLLQSLGATPAEEDGTPIGPGGAGLAALRTVDLAEARAALAGVDLVLATHVDNPLLGTAGTAAVYGPQKGASANDVRELDGALAGFVRRREAAGVPEAAGLADAPGAGAAGGLGYAGMLLGGRVCSGAEYFLSLLGADELPARSDFVVTGEGSLDEQSLSGKLPVALARRVRRLGVPVHAVAGRCTLPAYSTAACFRTVQALTDLTDRDCARDSALSAHLLAQCGRTLADRWIGRGGTETDR